jgi:hypothetical protein
LPFSLVHFSTWPEAAADNAIMSTPTIVFTLASPKCAGPPARWREHNEFVPQRQTIKARFVRGRKRAVRIHAAAPPGGAAACAEAAARGEFLRSIGNLRIIRSLRRT